ncbi:sulfate/molybdate ABC transporter ATP-binding protein [Psychromicrobium xiongbiense]|uniref:sulfate/molybdate ABC transporter ATP-binding protein n=1 Tax=Psychromicrobium xiongbiense TaxID=3051184 RepID=UPI002555DD59|nr:ATP-binding cassette domain-containing protein [Psychromicrobium sp. YIM S02556]
MSALDLRQQAPLGARLRAEVRVQRQEFSLEADLDVPAGRCLAILGPNGAGKSTVLAAIAGSLTHSAGRQGSLNSGSVRLGEGTQERLLDGPGLRAVPAADRQVTLMEQRPLLFPHLTLVDNIAFGPRARGMERGRARALASLWLERIGLADRSRDKPHQLSGGQQQRVALARAFAAGPQTILLDEPFAALDADSTPKVRALLARELQRTGTTAVLVTHSLSDAWQLAQECLVLDAGRVVERTTPAALAEAPRTRFTAVLAGFAVLEGMYSPGTGPEEGVLRVEGQQIAARPELDPLAAPTPGAPGLGIAAPREVLLHSAPASGALASTLETVEVRAGSLRLGATNGLVAEVELATAIRACGGSLPEPGARVWLQPRNVRVITAAAQPLAA